MAVGASRGRTPGSQQKRHPETIMAQQRAPPTHKPAQSTKTFLFQRIANVCFLVWGWLTGAIRGMASGSKRQGVTPSKFHQGVRKAQFLGVESEMKKPTLFGASMQQPEKMQRLREVSIDNWRNHCRLSKPQEPHKKAIQNNTKAPEYNCIKVPRGTETKKIRTQEKLMISSKEELNEGANKKKTCSK